LRAPARAEEGQPARRESETIDIKRIADDDPLVFAVVVDDGAGERHYEVTMSCADHARLGGDTHRPEAVIDAAFRFLLDREPKEAILARFDITTISRYFPEFERELPKYLALT
jgi:hypothetical protein